MFHLHLSLMLGVLIVYALGTAFYLIALKTNEIRWGRYATRLTYAGLAVHTATLLIRWYEAGYLPITNFYESLSFFAWSIVVLYLLLEYRYDIHSLGAFVIPIAFAAIFYAMLLPSEIRPLNPLLQSAWFKVHVPLSFFAYSSFAMSAALSVMYLILEKQIKSKRPHAFYYRLPSLEVLDALSYRLISIGFSLLTITIIIGTFWSLKAWGSYWEWEPKQTWSLISWIIYATQVHGRSVSGWRGKKAAYWSLLGFLTIIFTYLGVNVFGGGLHGFL